MKWKVLLSFALIAVSAAAAEGADSSRRSWSKAINAPARFAVLKAFDNAAILDVETGLVWERAPDTRDYLFKYAREHCAQLVLGGRMGWRLPVLHELMSLVDLGAVPTLPKGHPFRLGDRPFDPYVSRNFWSGTMDSFMFAKKVDLGDGSIVSANGQVPSNVAFRVWCVRGPGSSIEFGGP